MMFDCGLQNIFRLKNGQSRSINWENRNGEKGKGGMASSDLGPSRKGSPCIPKIEAGETVTLGEIQGEGIIQHIWITVTDIDGKYSISADAKGQLVFGYVGYEFAHFPRAHQQDFCL